MNIKEWIDKRRYYIVPDNLFAIKSGNIKSIENGYVVFRSGLFRSDDYVPPSFVFDTKEEARVGVIKYYEGQIKELQDKVNRYKSQEYKS